MRSEASELLQKLAESAPLDEGHEHIDAIRGDDLLLQLRQHLRLAGGPREQTAVRHRGLRTQRILCLPPEQALLILLTENTQKLLSRMLDLKLLFCLHIHRADDLIDIGDLITQRLIARGFINRIHLLLHELRCIGRKHTRRLRRIHLL